MLDPISAVSYLQLRRLRMSGQRSYFASLHGILLCVAFQLVLGSIFALLHLPPPETPKAEFDISPPLRRFGTIGLSDRTTSIWGQNDQAKRTSCAPLVPDAKECFHSDT